MDVVKLTYPLCKCDCEPKLTGIPPNVFIVADMEDIKKRFVEIRGNTKNYLTGLMDEKGVGGSNDLSDKIIEAINKSETRMETFLQGATIAKITVDDNHNNDAGVNEIHGCRDEGKGVDIDYYDVTG